MQFKRFIGLVLSLVMMISSLNVAFADETAEDSFGASVDKYEITTDNVVTESSVVVEDNNNMIVDAISVAREGIIQAVASFTDYSYSSYSGNGGTIYFDKGTGTITDASMFLVSIDIPEEIDGVKVTKIGNGAFKDCIGLKSVTIPSTVTEIGTYAFEGCVILNNIEIPGSVSYIREGAFMDCSDLISVELPGNIESIEDALFLRCYKLSDVSIPISVKTIGKQAFTATSLENIVIPEGVTKIGDYAFRTQPNGDCYSGGTIKTLSIPSSLTSLGEDAFGECSNLESLKTGQIGLNYNKWSRNTTLERVELLNDVYTIPDSCFTGCNSLTNVILSSNTKTIGNYAFYNCPLNKDFSFPLNVDSIGYYAFYNSFGLEEVIIPKRVTEIGMCAFADCINLSKVIIPEGVVELEDRTFANCRNLSAVTLPSSLNVIGKSVFYGCSLIDVNIPDSVIEIGDSAFYGCSNLLSVNLSNSLVKIGNSTFQNCVALKDISIPDRTENIGEYAFYNCEQLESIKIPLGVENIGKLAFSECNTIKSLILGQVGINYGWCDLKSLQKVEVLHGTTSIKSGVFCSCTNLTDVSIPNSIKSIGVIPVDSTTFVNGAFENCTSLTEINIPNSVNIIGNSTFKNCGGLTKIILPDSVNNIGNYAFSDCSSLTSIEIPNSVTSIGSYAFNGCDLIEHLILGQAGVIYGWSNKKALVGVELLDGVASIRESVFESCSNLTNVEIPNSVTNIGESAFESCSSLTNVEIPNSVTSIGDSAFRNCSGLTSIEVPNSVTSIGSYAFNGCSGLTSIEIPNSVTSIGDSAFRNCSSLTSIEVPNSVTSIGSYAFNGCNLIEYLILGQAGVNYGWSNKKALIGVELLDGVISIGNSTFDGCSSLTNIEISNSVTSIGESAFKYCSSLARIEIPSSVTGIGESAFLGCDSLTINCKSGSYAETYAQNNNIPYSTEGYVDYILTEADIPADVGEGIRFEKKIYEYDKNWFIMGEPPYKSSIKTVLKDEDMMDKVALSCSDTSVLDMESVQSKGYHIALLDTEGYNWQVTNNATLFKNGEAIVTATLPNGDSSSCLVRVKCYDMEYDFNNDFTKPNFTTSVTCENNLSYSNGRFSKSYIPLTVNYSNIYRIDHKYTDEESNQCKVKNLSIKISLPAGLSFSPDNISEKNKTISIGDVIVGGGDILTFDVYPTSYVSRKLNIKVSFKGDNVDVENGANIVVNSDDVLNYNVSSGTMEYVNTLSPESKIAFFMEQYNSTLSSFDKATASELSNLYKSGKVSEEQIYQNIKDTINSQMVVAYNPGLDDEIKEAINRALYQFISTETDNLIGINKIDITNNDVIIGAGLVNDVKNSIKNEILTYSVDFKNKQNKKVSYDVSFNVFGIWGAFKCDSFKVTNKSTGETISAFPTNANSNTEKVAAVMEAYVKQLQSIGVDVNNQGIASAVDFFMDTLGINKYLKNACLKKLEDALPILKNKGLGELVTYAKSISDDLNKFKKVDVNDLSSCTSSIKSIINKEFDETTVSNMVINSEFDKVKEARKNLIAAFNAYIYGYDMEDNVITKIFKSIHIMCPVDVIVYDSNGNEIGSVIDNIVNCDSDLINVTTIGESKKIYLLKDKEINLKIVATDYGNLNISVQNYNDENAPLFRENYYNIPLAIDEVFTTDNISADSTYTNIYSENNVYNCNEKLFAQNDESISVNVECKNGSVLGFGRYVKGDYVSLTAIPNDDYKFTGWYAGEELLSSSIIYNFTAYEDVSLKAAFAAVKENETLKGDLDGDNKVTVADALIVARLAIGKVKNDELYSLCDYDNDGRVTVNDALILARYALGKISQL